MVDFVKLNGTPVRATGLYRRTVAHNTMLVYKPGERFFWAENLWPAANDGGQRMDSSRYWNTVRSREDFRRTRDLWATGEMSCGFFVACMPCLPRVLRESLIWCKIRSALGA